MKSYLNPAAIGAALAVAGAATLTAGVAAAQNGPALRLYDQNGFGGQSVRLTQSTADLSAMRFGDRARSVVAEGRWEICFDANYAGSCRVIQGQVSDMGDWAARISSARYLGPSDWGSETANSGQSQALGQGASPAAVQATRSSPVAGPAASVEEAYVYASAARGVITPELVFDTLGATVSGTYTATQSETELDDIYRTGVYGITSGTVDGQMSGNTLTGYWYERATNAGLQIACDVERNGTLIYGRFTLTFSADRSSFSGLRSGCNTEPNPVDHEYYTWNGNLIRRQPAAAPNRNASTGMGTPGSPGTVPTDSRGQPLPGVVDRTARAAGDEVERRVQDRIREGIGRLF